MTSVYLAPTSTVSNTGTRTGGTTVHGVLSDSNPATYMALGDGQKFKLGLADLTLPSGAVILYAQLASQDACVIVPTTLKGTLNADVSKVESVGVNWLSRTGHAFAKQQGGLTDAGLDGATMELESVGGSAVIYECSVQVLYAIKPVPTILLPTGTLTEDNSPIVLWTTVWDPDYQPGQAKYRVKVFTDVVKTGGGFNPETSTAVLDSGEQELVTSGFQYHDFPDRLTNGTYWAYVKVSAIDGQWSDWDNEQFILNVSSPGTPTMTLTPQASNGRIKIDLDDNGATSTTYFHLQRSDDGVTFVDVPTTLGDGLIAPASGLATFYDYEARNGATSYYRARARHDYTSAQAYSDWATDDDTWSDPDQWWIKNPYDASTNMAVTLRGYGDVTHEARQGVFPVLGRKHPVIVSDEGGDSPVTGTLTVIIDNTDDRDAFDALMDLKVPMLLQGPVGHGRKDRWVVFGGHTSSPLLDSARLPHTDESVSWTEIERPDL